MQSNVDCWLPQCHIYPKMRDFERDLKERYSDRDEDIVKILAHPPKDSLVPPNTNYGHRMRIHEMRSNERNDPDNLLFDHSSTLLSSKLFSQFISEHSRPKRMVIAVGPDGGWSDDELYFFQRNNFHFVHLGDRIFRTDMAVISMLTIAQQWIEEAHPLE
jgi:16S rRNA U1498 N3-methylase RsmE